MDRKAIYLEADEEITSVVDKLKAVEGVSVDIVIPKEAVMLQSVVNLKLLQKQAESLGKEVTIVTKDKVGKKLAEQIGIPVVSKEGETPEVNITEEKKYSEEDIELKEKPDSDSGGSKESAIEVEDSEPAAEKQNVENKASSDSSEKKPIKKKNWFKKHWKGSLALGLLGFLALAVFAYIYVPLANINIKLAASKQPLDIVFTADKNNQEIDFGKYIIPAKEVVEEVEKSDIFKATGKKTIGEKATGSVTIVNHEYSTNPFTLTAGTRVVTSSGLVYKTKSNVTVPEYVKVGADITDGTVEVDVVAEDIGDKYNITGGNMTIPALLVSGVTSADIYAVGGTFSGGSQKEVIYVTSNDIKEGQESLANNIKNEIKSKINQNLGENEEFLEDAINFEEVSKSTSVASGGEAEEFKATVKIKGTALIISRDDLTALATEALKNSIESHKEIVESSSLISSTKISDFDSDKGLFKANLSGEAYIATKIEEEEIKNAINGDSEASAIDYLSQIDGVDEVNIRFFPSFYKRIPRINKHIYFKIEINKTQQENS